MPPTSPAPMCPRARPDPATLGTRVLFPLNSRGLDLERFLVKSFLGKEHVFLSMSGVGQALSWLIRKLGEDCLTGETQDSPGHNLDFTGPHFYPLPRRTNSELKTPGPFLKQKLLGFRVLSQLSESDP